MRTLGTGSFGRVHLVRSVHNGRYYAIKVLKKHQVVKMKQVEHTNDERRMLKLVEHPFLIRMWGLSKIPKIYLWLWTILKGRVIFIVKKVSEISQSSSQVLCSRGYLGFGVFAQS